MTGLGERKVHTTVYLTEDQFNRLDELSRVTRVPKSEYLRLVVEHLLVLHSEYVEADKAGMIEEVLTFFEWLDHIRLTWE